MKKIVNAYAYVYACLWMLCRFVKENCGWVIRLARRTDAAAGWAVQQIDHNDFLEGAIFGITLFLLPWVLGIINIAISTK